MNQIVIICISIISLLSNKGISQTPNDYTKGSITLSNGTVLQGAIKDLLKNKGTIRFMEHTNSKVKTYDGTELNEIIIGDTQYKCIKGDFFKIICNGSILFLTKASKTSTKVLYSGSEVIGLAGTEGKWGDYYIYNENILTLLTKKNIESTLSSQLISCPQAITKLNKDQIAANADAITLYNNCKK